MTISLVIPCFNEALYLPDCLQSILNQTLPPTEIIFADNQSSDSSLSIARCYQPQFIARKIKFRIISVKSPGANQVRRQAFALAKSPIIGTIDADSVLSPNWVKTIHSFFTDHPDTVALTGPAYSLNDHYNLSSLFNDLRLLPIIWWLIPRLRIFCGSNGAFKKTAYLQIGGLNHYFRMLKSLHLYLPKHEDYYLSEALKQVGKLGFSWQLSVRRRNHDTLKYLLQALLDYRKIYHYIHSPTFSLNPTASPL